MGGAVLLVIGFGLLGTIDHETSLWLIGVYIAIVGIGVGSLMQNLVLAVQNTVSVQNIGSASSSVAFFRRSAVRSVCRFSVRCSPPA